MTKNPIPVLPIDQIITRNLFRIKPWIDNLGQPQWALWSSLQPQGPIAVNFHRLVLEQAVIHLCQPEMPLDSKETIQ